MQIYQILGFLCVFVGSAATASELEDITIPNFYKFNASDIIRKIMAMGLNTKKLHKKTLGNGMNRMKISGAAISEHEEEVDGYFILDGIVKVYKKTTEVAKVVVGEVKSFSMKAVKLFGAFAGGGQGPEEYGDGDGPTHDPEATVRFLREYFGI